MIPQLRRAESLRKSESNRDSKSKMAMRSHKFFCSEKNKKGQKREKHIYFWTAERTSALSILPPRLDAKSIAASLLQPPVPSAEHKTTSFRSEHRMNLFYVKGKREVSEWGRKGEVAHVGWREKKEGGCSENLVTSVK